MNRSARGMSLIEVMIAVAVLAIAIVGLLTAMPVATQATRDAEQYEVARHAVERKIAEIRAAGVANASSFDAQVFTVDDLKKVNDDTECGSVTVTAGPDGTQEVSVLVLWRGIDKQNRQLEVRTLVGQ